MGGAQVDRKNAELQRVLVLKKKKKKKNAEDMIWSNTRSYFGVLELRK